MLPGIWKPAEGSGCVKYSGWCRFYKWNTWEISVGSNRDQEYTGTEAAEGQTYCSADTKSSRSRTVGWPETDQEGAAVFMPALYRHETERHRSAVRYRGIRRGPGRQASNSWDWKWQKTKEENSENNQFAEVVNNEDLTLLILPMCPCRKYMPALLLLR